jgi:cytoskeleton protein RodZ
MTQVDLPDTKVVDVEAEADDRQPGERLKQAREALGFSLEDIASHLHLGVDKIAALERSEVEGIAAPVFLAGYLRAYAKKVDLPSEEIIAAYDALNEIETPAIAPGTKDYGKMQPSLPSFASHGSGGLSPWLGWGVLGLVIVAGATLAWKLMGDSANVNETELTRSIEGTALDPATDLNTPTVVDSADTTMEGDSSGITAKAASDAEMQPELAPKKTLPPLAPRAQLTLSFREDSWAEIRDAQGNRIMHRLGRAGEERSVTGVAPFEVVLGFTPGVDLQYNGEPYDLSRYKNRRLVRFSVGSEGDEITP